VWIGKRGRPNSSLHRSSHASFWHRVSVAPCVDHDHMTPVLMGIVALFNGCVRAVCYTWHRFGSCDVHEGRVHSWSGETLPYVHSQLTTQRTTTRYDLALSSICSSSKRNEFSGSFEHCINDLTLRYSDSDTCPVMSSPNCWASSFSVHFGICPVADSESKSCPMNTVPANENNARRKMTETCRERGCLKSVYRAHAQLAVRRNREAPAFSTSAARVLRSGRRSLPAVPTRSSPKPERGKV